MKESVLRNELNLTIDKINNHLAENKMKKSIWIDITTNSRMIDVTKNVLKIVKGGKKEKLGERTNQKKQYYGIIRLFQKEMIEDDKGEKKEAKFLLCNIEYPFANPSDQLNTYHWQTELCRSMLYEFVGGFAALARGVFEQQKAEQHPNISQYDSEKNTYTRVNLTEKQEEV